MCFKISYDKKCKNCDNLGLQIKLLSKFRLYQKNIPQICLILHQFNFYVLLTRTGCIGEIIAFYETLNDKKFAYP